MSLFVTADALPGIEQYFERAADATPSAASMAMNKVMQGVGRTRIRQAMEEEVAFPKGYINDKRLSVGRRATPTQLEASLIARQRATSLARFDRGAVPGQRGANVMVRPGFSRAMPSAFFIRLRSGASVSEDNYNLGLAIRLKPGERIYNKKTSFNADQTLHILYGPSVDQIMQEVSDEQTPAVLEDIETEFLRNFVRLTE